MSRDASTTQNEEHSPQTLSASVKEALHGSKRDFTKGPIGTAILLLAIPMVLEMLMESIFAVVDVFYVGKLGPSAVATVGLTESLLVLIYTIAIGLSIGASAMVARRIGEKDPETAATTAIQALVLGGLISLAIGLIGSFFASDLLTLMGASPEVLSQGLGFTRLMLGGNIVVMLLFITNAIFRGAGDGAIAMRALWIANWINIILCPCFIFGFGPIPAFGVTGAAIGTTIGRGTGAIYVLTRLFSGKGRLHVKKANLKLQPKVMLNILRLSGSATFQVFIGMASWIGLVRILSTFGSAAIAGYTIGLRVVLFALFPSFGMSNAAATMVGQALGAKDPERAEAAVWRTGLYNVVFLGIIGTLFVVFAPFIVSIFTTDTEVMHYGTACLRTVSTGFIFYAYGQVLTQSFNGAGDTWTPTIINLFVFWILEIPMAYVLAKPLGFGPQGVFFSMTIAFSTLAIVSAIIFKKGHWKTRKV